MWVMQQLNEKGLGNVISPNYEVLHTPPAVSLIKTYNALMAAYQLTVQQAQLAGQHPPALPQCVQIPSNENYTAANRYQTDIQRMESVFGQTLTTVLSNLSAVQVANVVHITIDPLVNGRLKAITIINYNRDIYGTNSMANTNPIKDQMQKIPEAFDAPSADYVLSALAF
jgi:hypothetical protein